MIFYPSSVVVDAEASDLLEYAMAKTMVNGSAPKLQKKSPD